MAIDPECLRYIGDRVDARQQSQGSTTVPRLVLFCICTIAVLGAASLAGKAAPLVSPVDSEARRALVGRPLGSFTCENPVAPMRDIRADSFYSDPEHSIIDPARNAARLVVVKPLQDFVSGVARMADRWLGSRPPQTEAAHCALAWLDAWARADAMLG